MAVAGAAFPATTALAFTPRMVSVDAPDSSIDVDGFLDRCGHWCSDVAHGDSELLAALKAGNMAEVRRLLAMKIQAMGEAVPWDKLNELTGRITAELPDNPETESMAPAPAPTPGPSGVAPTAVDEPAGGGMLDSLKDLWGDIWSQVSGLISDVPWAALLPVLLIFGFIALALLDS